MTVDFYGEKRTNEISCSVFHDEREIQSQWLYHGFLFVPTGNEDLIVDRIVRERDASTWEKEIHFSKLQNTKTMVDLAMRLTDAFCNYFRDISYFYLMGIDYQNLAKELWVDRKTRDQRIYNRFFQIGLYSAIKWFFLFKDSDVERVTIQTIYSDAKSRTVDDLFHSMPISDTSFKAVIKDEPIVFMDKRIVEVDSDHERETKYIQQSHIIQLADLLVGAFGQALDATSQQEGKCKVADVLTRHGLPGILMKYCEPYYSSPYYKKVNVSFFPREQLTKEEIISEQVFKRVRQFYNSREVKFLNREQERLFQ